MTGEPLARQVDPFAVVRNDPADRLGAPPVPPEDRQYPVGVARGDENTKTHPHIVNLEHFGSADRPVLLDQTKDRGRRRQVVQVKSDLRIDPG